MPKRFTTISAIALCAAGAACLSSQTFAADVAPKLNLPQADTPADPAAAARTLEAEIQRAESLRAQGNYTEATRVLSQLMLGAPDDGRVVGEYGKALAQQGRSQDAIAFLKRATELQPNDWSLYSALGVAYDQADDPKDAKAAFERALVLKPGNPVVLNNYAVSRMLSGDLDGAEKLLAQAKLSGPISPKIASNAALLAQMKLNKSVASANRTSAPVANTAPAAGGRKPVGTAPGNAVPSPVRVVTTVSANTAAVKAAANGGATLAVRSSGALASRPSQSGSVIMQKVPTDPLAGPVARATKSPRRLTTRSTTSSGPLLAKTAVKKSAAPMLRTADQAD